MRAAMSEASPLSSSSMIYNPEFRSIIGHPDEALLLTQCRPANGASTGDGEPDGFFIAEIDLRGTHGEFKVTGEQTHKTFVRNKNTYTLTYY
jgi:hypothetical protein